MNHLLDLAIALITSPRQALMEITNEEKLKEAFLIWIFVVFLLSLSLFQQGPGLVVQFLLMVLFMGAALLVHSAVIDYISGFWRHGYGPGDYRRLHGIFPAHGLFCFLHLPGSGGGGGPFRHRQLCYLGVVLLSGRDSHWTELSFPSGEIFPHCPDTLYPYGDFLHRPYGSWRGGSGGGHCQYAGRAEP